MEFTYNKIDKELTISGILVNLEEMNGSTSSLYINDSFISKLESNTYIHKFLSDNLYKIEVRVYDEDDVEMDTVETYELVVEYSKDKNRTLLVSILNNLSYKDLSTVYINNRKIIREIENSYAASIPERCIQLFKALSW